MVMLDGAGRPRAVLQTVRLTLRRFGRFAPDLLLHGEGFRLVARLGPGTR